MKHTKPSSMHFHSQHLQHKDDIPREYLSVNKYTHSPAVCQPWITRGACFIIGKFGPVWLFHLLTHFFPLGFCRGSFFSVITIWLYSGITVQLWVANCTQNRASTLHLTPPAVEAESVINDVVFTHLLPALQWVNQDHETQWVADRRGTECTGTITDAKQRRFFNSKPRIVR